MINKLQYFDMKRFLIIFTIFSINSTPSCTSNGNKTEIKEEQVNQQIDKSEMHINDESIILDTLLIQEKDGIIKFINNIRTLVENDGEEFYDLFYNDEPTMNIGITLYNYWLKRNGFTFPSDADFTEKLKVFFNIETPYPANIVDHSNFFTYITPRDEDMMDYKSFPEGSEWDSTYKNIYIVKKRNYIIILSELGTLAQLQENGQYRTFFSENILHYNKFLFNNNNASLTWLINNDIEFLELLIKEFNYDKNDKINEAVLNKIYIEYSNKAIYEGKKETLIGLFAKKNHSGKLNIHTQLMKYILNVTTKEDNKYLSLLEGFGYDLLSIHDTEKIKESFTEKEILQIVAYIAYFSQKAYDLHWEKYSQNWPAISILYSILSNEDEISKKFLKQVRENNYYELGDFENMINNMLEYIEDEPELRF